MDKLPEAAIEVAEERAAVVAHSHADRLGDDGLLEHIRSAHGLDSPEHLSRSTLDGLHDRLHDGPDAAARERS